MNAQVHKSSKWRERKTKFMSLTTLFDRMIKSYEVMESNLPPEDKRMHKFTKVASGEREKQISCHSPHFLSE